jgi:hypothetical protein
MRFRAYLLVNTAPVYRPPPLPEPRFDPWADLEWHEHREAQDAVRLFPEGMTLEQIGSRMGITRERVRQIEGAALRKLIDCAGTEVIDVGRHTYAVPDCEDCGLPFVRVMGSDRNCDECTAMRRRRRRTH